MKNKLILLILTFLITTPLIAMEEGAGPFRGDVRSPASPEALITVILEDDQVNLDKKTLLQSEMVKGAFRFDKDRKTVSLDGFTKDQFMQAYQLMEYAFYNENEKLQLALTSKDISELSSLWQIFDYLDVPVLQKKTQTQLDNTLASHIEENPGSIPDLLTQLPESFKQHKFSIPFSSNLLPKDLVSPLFNELATLNHDSLVSSIAFDSAHSLLAIGSSNDTKVYNSSDLTNDSKPIATLKHGNLAYSVAFDPEHNLLAIGLLESSAKIYDSSNLNNNSQPIATLKHSGSVTSVAFDPEHKLLATGSYGSLESSAKIYDSSNLNNNSQPIATLKHGGSVTSVAFDPEHKLLATGSSNGTKIYDSSNLNNNSQPIATLKHDASVLSVAFDPEHKLLATGSSNGTARIYNSSDLNNNSQPIATLKHGNLAYSVAFDSAHSLLAIGSSNDTKVYNSSDLTNDSKPIATLKHDALVTSVAFDPEHKLLATGSSNGTKIYKFSIFHTLPNEQGLAVLYLLLTKPESLTNVPEVIQQIIATIDKETWDIISEHLKPKKEIK